MKVLIFYTSIGHGHKSIAENIGWQLGDAGCDVQLADILKVQEGRLVEISKSVHRFINRHLPYLWSWLYHGTNTFLASWLEPVRVWVAGRNCRQAEELIRRFEPDLVITTQTTASAVLAYLVKRGWYRRQWGIAFSDYHLHRFWLYQGADFYLANTREQKQDMVKLGVSADRIHVCGIALQPSAPVNPEAVRAKLGIRAGMKVVLLGSGSLGIGMNAEVLRQVASVPDTHLIIACGGNEELVRELSSRYGQLPHVTVLGYYRPMDELYAVADAFITKPGGLTVAEALRWRLPLFITHWLPGQEELNIGYLATRRLAVAGKFSVELLTQELAHGTLRKALSGNPEVAEIISAPGLRSWISGLLHRRNESAARAPAAHDREA